MTQSSLDPGHARLMVSLTTFASPALQLAERAPVPPRRPFRGQAKRITPSVLQALTAKTVPTPASASPSSNVRHACNHPAPGLGAARLSGGVLRLLQTDHPCRTDGERRSAKPSTLLPAFARCAPPEGMLATNLRSLRISAEAVEHQAQGRLALLKLKALDDVAVGAEDQPSVLVARETD